MYIHTFQERWLQENHLPQVTKIEKTYHFCFARFHLDRLPRNALKKQFLSHAYRIANKGDFAEKQILLKLLHCVLSFLLLGTLN